jgi:eukaryotic-like serine/threonine-protein kinase
MLVAVSVPKPQPFQPPEEFDDYVIVRELGRGQMGQVYLAEDAVLARPVAIKFIGGGEPDIEARRRFLLEARAAARIQHPNVVGIYRVGELDDRPYIVSELIRGTPLSQLRRPMPTRRALDLAIQLARGLAAAHRRGVVHCDVKPHNVMVTEDGVAKLVDFGLARVVHEGDADSDDIVGTPDYMAPEVWEGRAPSRRSDIYSFGAMLFELISGRVPFAEVPALDLPEVVCGRDAPDLATKVSEVDPRIAKVVARCLARDPDARFASGEELREGLEQLSAGRRQAVRSDENPYRGLRTFETSHRGVFFGRGLEVSEIVERLRSEAVVIVAGDSGVGKSSLLRAGVMPAILDGALEDDRVWEAVTMVPGRRPLAALAAGLGDPALARRVLEDPEELPRALRRRAGGRGLVLFIDQLEELVTVGDRDEVEALEGGLARLSEGVPGVRLVASVRADFLSRIAALPRLGRELSRLLFFVAPLPPERIRDVITGPAAVTGVQFESPELVGELVEATTRAGSGGLPLLSFTLAELWEARDRDTNTITRATLDAMGGVAGALARHGDAVIAGMPAADRGHARRVLLRLVTSDGTRVRRTEAELAVSANTRIALDALVKGRLLVVHDGEDGATYELAHEVLVHGWGTLREWLDADADDRARRERVAAAAAEWQRVGRRVDLTWRDRRLAEARALDLANLTPLERDFVMASMRSARRRSWLRAAMLAGVLALVVGAVLAQRRLAHDRLADAVAAEVAAATQFLERARAADRGWRVLATAAHAKFDAGDADAEAAWERVVDARTTARREYRTAAQRIEAALAKDPAREDVRALLGDILYDRAVLAEAVGEDHEELIERVAAYDPDGSRRARWNAPATLVVRADQVELALETADGTQASDASSTRPRKLRAIGLGSAELEVAPGSYTIVGRAPGREAVRLPIHIERGARIELGLTLPPAGSVPPGFVYVPPGPFVYGSADEDTRTSFYGASPARTRTTGAFLIARTETTIAEWLEFVEAQPEQTRAALLPNIATQMTGALVLERAGRAWRLTMQPLGQTYVSSGDIIEYPGRPTHARQSWMRLPITGISATLAESYLAWLDRTGRVVGARLCSEVEWERAARGADGREFPHGAALEQGDANIDTTYGRELMGLDEVGAHPTSTSPFGLADMSGNAFEWTRGEHGGYVVRGGSYFHDRKTANLTNRAALPPDLRDATLGLRVCANPPAP